MASWLGALATAIVAAVAGITAAAIAHSAKISEFRQAWINALRDDIATYFKELDGVHFYVGKLLKNTDSARVEEFEQQKHEARARLMLVYYRITLRLNMKESPHRSLIEKLKGFWVVEAAVVDQAKVDEAMIVAQALLKEEWDVAKELPLSRWFKRALSRLSPKKVFVYRGRRETQEYGTNNAADKLSPISTAFRSLHATANRKICSRKQFSP